MTITRKTVRPPKSMTAHELVRVEAEPGKPIPFAELREAWAAGGGDYTIESRVTDAKRLSLAVLSDKGVDAGRVHEASGRYSEPWHRTTPESIEWHAGRLLKSVRAYREFKKRPDAAPNAELTAYEIGCGAAILSMKIQWEDYADSGLRTVEGARGQNEQRKIVASSSHAEWERLALEFLDRHPDKSASWIATQILTNHEPALADRDGRPPRSHRTIRDAIGPVVKKVGNQRRAAK